MSGSFETPRTVACQAPLTMGSSRQESWRGLPCPSLGHVSDPGIKPTSALQMDSLPLSHWRSPNERGGAGGKTCCSQYTLMRNVSQRLSLVWRTAGEETQPSEPKHHSSSYKKIATTAWWQHVQIMHITAFSVTISFPNSVPMCWKMYLKYSEVQRRDFFKSHATFFFQGNLIKFKKRKLWFTLVFILICSNFIK